MGCSASRLDTILAKAMIEEDVIHSLSSSSSSNNSLTKSIKTRSLSAPLIHHPAQGKGDTHHLVSLTSSTYGSLIIVENSNSDSNISHKDCDFDDFDGKSSPDSVINTWELMEGLEGEDEFGAFVGKDSNFSGFDSKLRKPSLEFGRKDGFDGGKKKPSSRLGFMSDFSDAQMKKSLKLGLEYSDNMGKLCDTYVFVEMPEEDGEEKGENGVSNSSSKPLWKHLSEESLLSKMDPNVSASYQRALSANKLSNDRSIRAAKSVGSSPFVSKSSSVGSSPAMLKVCGGDNAGKKPRSEEKIVLYFTSVRGIRRTYEDCCMARMILRGFRVLVDEKDISMDTSYRKELQNALGGKPFSLPQLFIGGKHIGGADEISQLHEAGELEKLCDGFPAKDHSFVCKTCGEARFIPCSNCSGSRKVFHEEEGRMRRCTMCNENGLVRCPGCCA